MKTVKLIVIFLLLVMVAGFFTPSVFATAKTDYDFQWQQYRQNYSEFALLKRDYLANQTLDNQQKAILSAKQTLMARDLAKDAYARYLVDLINAQNTGYTALNPIIDRLKAASAFYVAEAQLSQKIITTNDLKTFALDYYDKTQIFDRSFEYGQIAVKIATLVRFQIDLKNNFDVLVPKLPDPLPAALKARLDEVPSLAQNINDKIATISARIIPENEEGILNQENYFNPFVDKLDEIKTLQLNLVNQFVDMDINYVQPKI